MHYFDSRCFLLVAIISIWGILIINLGLTIAGYTYYLKWQHTKEPELPPKPPFVSIMVRAHNEGVVIVKTVQALLNFSYPKSQYEVIVINDNSSDNSAELLKGLQDLYADRQLVVINTDSKTGGKGKSNALNIGLKVAKGSVISVYDADNTPEKNALSILVAELLQTDQVGAVIGKFRTRNKNATILTRFINIETLAFQWMAQAVGDSCLNYVRSRGLITLFADLSWKRSVVGM